MLNPLSLLTPGQSAVIHWLPEQPAIVSRLLDLGFVPGAAVTCTLRRGNGSISAFLVRNAVIALRKEDAQLILAEPLPSCCAERLPVVQQNSGEYESFKGGGSL